MYKRRGSHVRGHWRNGSWINAHNRLGSIVHNSRSTDSKNEYPRYVDGFFQGSEKNNIHHNFFESFTNPNASCPKCRASVFFYQSENGGCVYLDALGPPWPKHPCTDKSNTITKTPTVDKLSWKKAGWEPFELYKSYVSDGCTKIEGKFEIGKKFSLYIKNLDVHLVKGLPIQLKKLDKDSYLLSTFTYNNTSNDIEVFQRKVFVKPEIANIKSQDFFKFQLDPTKSQKKILIDFFREAELLIELWEKEVSSSIKFNIDIFFIFLLIHKDKLSFRYLNCDGLYDIIDNYIKSKIIKHGFLDNCTLSRNNCFYFPIPEIQPNTIKPVNIGEVAHWRKTVLKRRKYIPAFYLIKQGADFFVDIQLE